MSSLKLTGITAAPVTPMDESGNVNYSQIEVLARLYEKNGLTGVFISGSTGEGTSLTHSEKKEILKVWAEVKGNLKTIYCVGGTSIREMQDLVEMSQRFGLDGYSILPPYYFKPGTIEDMIEISGQIAAVAPELPFYYYHIPGLTGCYFSMREYLEQASEKLPSLVGIKYSHSDLYDFQRARMYQNGKYNMLWGTDEVLFSALVAGADGAVGSTYNYAAPLYHRIIAAFEAGNFEEALKWQDKAVEMVSLLLKYGGTGATKEFMKMIGVDCGGYRLPLRSPSGEGIRELERELEGIGFFEFCSKK